VWLVVDMTPKAVRLVDAYSECGTWTGRCPVKPDGPPLSPAVERNMRCGAERAYWRRLDPDCE
jgi:hypothetical protein